MKIIKQSPFIHNTYTCDFCESEFRLSNDDIKGIYPEGLVHCPVCGKQISVVGHLDDELCVQRDYKVDVDKVFRKYALKIQDLEDDDVKKQLKIFIDDVYNDVMDVWENCDDT